MLKFTHLIKIILVLKISLKTLHLGIHKWELNKRSLVPSVFYFSLNIDVVFAVFPITGYQPIKTSCCWALVLRASSSGNLWWRPLRLSDFFFCLGS